MANQNSSPRNPVCLDLYTTKTRPEIRDFWQLLQVKCIYNKYTFYQFCYMSGGKNLRIHTNFKKRPQFVFIQLYTSNCQYKTFYSR